MYVRNDTGYCSHIYDNTLHVYDFSNLDNLDNLIPMASISTTKYNHSNWLSENGKTLIIADESHDVPVQLVDMSNMESPQKKATLQSDLLAPTGSLAHNPFIIGNDFAIISYYEDGVQIYKIDSINQPFNAGYYDTRPDGNSYNGYNGAWGTYPFLPSGNILVSDVDSGLFVVRPQFPLHDCESNVEVNGTYDNHWDIISKDSLTNSSVYMNNADLLLQAPNNIVLASGFEVEIGSKIEVNIEDKCSAIPFPFKINTLQKPKDRD